MSVNRVAVVQAASVVFDREATIDKARRLAKEAAGEGAKLVLFPEGFVSAYPEGLDVGSRTCFTREGQEDYRRYHDSAVDVPGPATHALGAIARENGIYLVIGVIERDGGTLYCTALFFSPDGALMGKHRKLMPTAWERLVWGQGDGSTMPVFDTPVGKIGAVICWENYMPLLRTYMYSQGVQLYLAPTADDYDTWLPSMRHIAVEGRCYVLTCCQYLTRGDCPDDYVTNKGEDPKTVILRGGSCIVSPSGRVLAGPNYEGEAILTADVDLDKVTRAKFTFDAVGHYARPDVFQLHVNTRPNLGVVAHGGPTPDPFLRGD